ncbi:benzoate/H(+) symporter BenE family transporter [Paenibacillus validus]|uniref:benzoate/H(+) symporter BenE family transporter n=1 Tax=Paenibacillus TaxID=44249 RepID=UPI000FD71CA0|nr:benzoate/H(+) symporter BenE family transporter [Paenibacillus validus]MED4602842.1 benzoate/H(+) symporter BenE family transporter [Paenibacillus validus]MED4607316.1 benzoate/H(+) symporter BenE family transporter [Paenibacillus validus]
MKGRFRFTSLNPFSMNHCTSGFIAWLFGVTGPFLIILQSAAQGQLQPEATSSWVFAVYATGGALTIMLSVLYKQPIAVAFSIPGAVLVGTSLSNHPFNVVIGAYVLTGLLILLLGMVGLVEKLMKSIPLPIMMGMVSGVLLPFGSNVVTSLKDAPLLNGLTLLTFLVLSYFTRWAKRIPPILGAIAVSAVWLIFFGGSPAGEIVFRIAKPHVYSPAFDWSTIGELVIPLAMTVIAVQNAQGIGVLRGDGYEPPVNAMTRWSGIGSLANALMGAHSACIAGPMTAILTDEKNGPKEHRYLGSIVMGALWVLFGLLAPMAVLLTDSIPASLIKLLGGLAMIGVLVNSLQMSFSAGHKLGALFAFMITLSDITLFRIGAPFWGLAGGIVFSFILEKQDWRKINIKAVVTK